QSELTSHVHQTLAALPLVQAFGAEKRSGARFRELARRAAACAQRGSALELAHGQLSGSITIAGTAVVLFVGGSRVLAGASSPGTLLLFVAYLQAMQG